MMDPSKEKYYQPGITTDRDRRGGMLGDSELDLPMSPVLDYPPHHNRHQPVVLDYERTPDRAPDRVDRLIGWCIEHQLAISVALWALIAAGVGALIVVW